MDKSTLVDHFTPPHVSMDDTFILAIPLGKVNHSPQFKKLVNSKLTRFPAPSSGNSNWDNHSFSPGAGFVIIEVRNVKEAPYGSKN